MKENIEFLNYIYKISKLSLIELQEIKPSIQDKEILSIIKKYDFWNKNDKIGTKQKIYHMYKITDDFNPEDYTYFLIKDLNMERYYKKYFHLLNGIGVDGKHNKILYYHIIPED